MEKQLERFGLIKDAAWHRILNGVGDNLLNHNYLKDQRIELDIGDWAITIDSYSTNEKTYTRLRAPYINTENFRFKVFRKGFFSNLMKLFGMQDIEIENTAFDENFIIQATDKDKIKALFSDYLIREMIMNLDSVLIQVKEDESWFKDKYPNGIDELYIEVPVLVQDIEQLEVMFLILAKIFQYLCNISKGYHKGDKF